VGALAQLADGAKYEIYDSPLSGRRAWFEYGYSVAAPSALVL
jgi:2-oxoglutarate dehydrogenase complex dehydrogenase (E1) component-like enzyme